MSGDDGGHHSSSACARLPLRSGRYRHPVSGWPAPLRAMPSSTIAPTHLVALPSRSTGPGLAHVPFYVGAPGASLFSEAAPPAGPSSGRVTSLRQSQPKLSHAHQVPALPLLPNMRGPSVEEKLALTAGGREIHNTPMIYRAPAAPLIVPLVQACVTQSGSCLVDARNPERAAHCGSCRRRIPTHDQGTHCCCGPCGKTGLARHYSSSVNASFARFTRKGPQPICVP